MRREHYYQQELGKLYSRLIADLAEMHQAIDEYVERLYRHEPFHDDEERTAFLLELYAQAVAEEQGLRQRQALTGLRRSCVQPAIPTAVSRTMTMLAHPAPYLLHADETGICGLPP